MNDLHLTIDLSGIRVDWQQPVDIVETGGVDAAYRLRDPEVDITVSGETYLAARRLLSLARRVHERTTRAAEQAFEHSVQRELARGIRVQGGPA